MLSTVFDMVEALEVAAVIAGCRDIDELYESLCAHSRRSIRSDWACVVDEQGRLIAESGTLPVAHVVWMPLPSAGSSFVLGRSCSTFQAEERRTAAALARIADSLSSRIREQQGLRSVLCHPSNGLSEVSLHVE